ncbi:MAG: head-tail connector protein [Caloramator sp.]|nr:head-tail connector protein [Caloramator sp.]
MNLKVIEGPKADVLTLEEVKSHLRVDGDDEDSIISSYIKAAREYAEIFTGRSFVEKTYEYITNPKEKYAYIELPMPPLVEVLEVSAMQSTNEELLNEGKDYYIIKGYDESLIYPSLERGWPKETLDRLGGIKVKYRAGYSEAPMSVKQAILILVAHFYENRENLIARDYKEIPFGVSSLLRPFWVPRW